MEVSPNSPGPKEKSGSDIDEKLDEKDLKIRMLKEELEKSREEKEKLTGIFTESQEKLLSLLDDLPESVYISDPLTNEILFVNREIRERRGDLKGEKCHEALYGQDDPCPFCFNPYLFSPGNDSQYVREFYNEKSRRWFRCFDRTLIWLDGREVHCGISVDITDDEEIVEELLRFQKFESLSILSGGIAHDFNNCLTSIMGNLSLACLMVSPEDEASDILTEAKKSSILARDLTRQLLTFSKGGTPVRKTTPIGELIANSTRFSLRGSNIICKFSLPGDLWPLEIDSGQIGQVINNLVINAEQAMPGGGTINVGAENLIIDGSQKLPLPEGKYVKITIEDQGLGIPAEHLSSIFDPYFSTKKDGTGLGLATAYFIIMRHDGHITVSSKIDEGTTFAIYLPASEKEIEVKKEEPKLPRPLVKGKILIMDDNRIVRKALEKMLSYLGYKVESVDDGGKAIETYKKARESKNPFDAVILDLTVPGGMGGKEAVLHLMDYDPRIKAIASSGYTDDEELLKNLEKYGFCAFIPKPYTVEDLGDTLYDVLMQNKE